MKIIDDRGICEVERTGEGWWAYYKDGWKSSSDPRGAVHYDKERTPQSLNKMIRNALPCECDECKPKPKE